MSRAAMTRVVQASAHPMHGRTENRPISIARSRLSSASAAATRCVLAPRVSLQPQTGQGKLMRGSEPSFALEHWLAAFEESRGAFAHVLRGEYEAELRGFVFE